MRDELIEKLNRLLEDRTTFSEAEAVYFLVEARKLLDRRNENGGEDAFPLLRFYADWSVHTAKSRRLGAIQKVAERIASVPPESDRPSVLDTDRWKPHLDFAYMTELREEMNGFLLEFGIRHRLSTDEVWANFVGSLVAVLHDQPIENPIPTIAEIRFETSVPGSAVWVVTFTDGRPPVKLGNVF